MCYYYNFIVHCKSEVLSVLLLVDFCPFFLRNSDILITWRNHLHCLTLSFVAWFHVLYLNCSKVLSKLKVFWNFCRVIFVLTIIIRVFDYAFLFSCRKSYYLIFVYCFTASFTLSSSAFIYKIAFNCFCYFLQYFL